MIGYLFSRNGAAIKTHDTLEAALQQAQDWMVFERVRPCEVEEMNYSREHGWTITGVVHRIHGPLVPALFSRTAQLLSSAR